MSVQRNCWLNFDPSRSAGNVCAEKGQLYHGSASRKIARSEQRQTVELMLSSVVDGELEQAENATSCVSSEVGGWFSAITF